MTRIGPLNTCNLGDIHVHSAIVFSGRRHLFVNDNVSVMKKESLMLATFSSNISYFIFPHSLAFLKKSQNIILLLLLLTYEL